MTNNDQENLLWKTPIYRFRVPTDPESEESLKLKELVFDVTGSAPPFTEPSEALKSVLKEIFGSTALTNVDSVLEFGAAKLKNIPFILKCGKSVCAVEFEELSKNEITKENLKKCKKFRSKFQQLLFPHPFIADHNKFDLALLINVLPVMPVFAERLYALQLLYEKIKREKYLLWFAQKEGNYKKDRESGKYECGDGIWMGKNRHFKTFYRYHKSADVDELMTLYGFKLIKRFSVPDDARLYQKTDHSLFTGLITPERIRKHIPVDSTIKDPQEFNPRIVTHSENVNSIVPNPRDLSIESLYLEKIKSIPCGPEHAEIYHRVISYAMARVFRDSLRNMEIKVEVNGGVKIIDTVFSNRADKGFFESLRSKYDASYVIVEAKNISGDPNNSEFDQLNGRLTRNHGRFGILVCRHADDEEAVLARCKTFLPDHSILYLTDDDISELLEYSRANEDLEIDDLMDRKLRELLF